MELKAFGNTPLKVPKMGLGLAALGRPGYINLGHGKDLEFHYDVEAMQANAWEVLDEAYKLGVRYFDVARSYGKGEEFLSNWLKDKKNAQELVVGSKWGYTYTADWKVDTEKHEVKEHSLEVLDRQWPISLGLLGEKLKIYHIHSATLESGVLDNTEVLNRLWELKGSGIVVGLSLSGEHQDKTLEKALTISRGNEHLFQSVQATWNILEQSSTNILAKASRKGMGIIIKEALANGRLTARNDEPNFAKKKEKLQSMAQKYELGIDGLSLAFVMQQPWASTVLSGASTKEQLISNFKALDVTISPEDMDILQGMAESPAEYWSIRSGLAWN